MMDLNQVYDIPDTANYVLNRGFTRVALQFPDELLKDSTAVVSLLRIELERQRLTRDISIGSCSPIQLYVLADTTYGSCCADEIAAAHVNAECIIHYGHTCFSQMSRLPIWYVLGRASIDHEDCAGKLSEYIMSRQQDLLVLYGLEYAYAMPMLEESMHKRVAAISAVHVKITFAEVPHKEVNPIVPVCDRRKEPSEGNCTDIHGAFGEDACCKGKCIRYGSTESQEVRGSKKCLHNNQQGQEGSSQTDQSEMASTWNELRDISFGGLKWRFPEYNNNSMEHSSVVWIGKESPTLTNFMLTFNKAMVVRYDPETKVLLTDEKNQSKALRRRYYLVERAKDANIVGIIVGTLGVAGYQQIIQHIRRLIKEAGKKSYTLVMGRPNPSKLANFPECDVFVLVACAQTALLDSKEFLSPLITPFEAVLSFTRGMQWMGTYHLDFQAVINSSIAQRFALSCEENNEARFSFFKGGYVEESNSQVPEEKSMILSSTTQQTLQPPANARSDLTVNREAKSGAEFFALRSFKGLEIQNQSEAPVQYHIHGRKGRASVYEDEIDEAN
eukprot:c23421_g1_i1 orf=135-1808(+)